MFSILRAAKNCASFDRSNQLESARDKLPPESEQNLLLAHSLETRLLDNLE